MPATSSRSPRPPARPADPRPDGLLLSLFHTQADETAFAALVVRHTPLVRAVCGTWLRSAADVDDAAQSTFLVLVKRADSIRDPGKLGPWLCRVAGYVARRLRKQLGRSAPLDVDPSARQAPPTDDRLESLLVELARLPEQYRLPVQLHYSAGLSTAEIADQLGWPRGTVLTRLDRARKLLERRLAARGVSVAALAGTAGVGRSVSAGWVQATARGAAAVRAAMKATTVGVSERTVSLTEGVARTMKWNQLRLMLAAVMLATGLGGFALGQWGTDRKPKEPVPVAAERAQAARAAQPEPDEPKPVTGRRTQAVIKVPSGTFAKEIDAPPYGSGRITWTYADEQVTGVIEGSVMGVEFELHTTAEYSLSSTGTIYGIVTSVEVVRLKTGAGGELGEELAAYAGLWKVAEPLLNEVLTDLPFSYQFRLVGDRLTILNYRALLAGPNPFGKVGLAEAAGELAYFQALGVAVEGTYTAVDAEKPAGLKKASFSPRR